MDFQKLMETITPEIYENFKRAVETGKWPDTRPLTEEQKALCLQAIIVYEQRIPEEQRTGYVPPKTSPCAEPSADHSDTEQPLKWHKD